MVERKTKAKLPTGQTVDAFEVPVEELTERWSDYKLEDGSALRMKMNVLSVNRIPNMWDPQGNPFYLVNVSPVMTVVEAPQHLRKKATQ